MYYNNPNQECAKGNKFLVAQNYNEAIKEFQKDLVQNSHDLCARIGLSIAEFQMGKFDLAMKLLEEISVFYKSNSYILYNLAVYYFQRKDWYSCVDNCSKGLQVTNAGKKALANLSLPEFANTFYRMRCISYFQLGNLASATEDYMMAINCENMRKVVTSMRFSATVRKPLRNYFIPAELSFGNELNLFSANEGIKDESEEKYVFSSISSKVNERNQKSTVHPGKQLIRLMTQSSQRTIKYSPRVATPREVKLNNKAEQSTPTLIKAKPRITIINKTNINKIPSKEEEIKLVINTPKNNSRITYDRPKIIAEGMKKTTETNNQFYNELYEDAIYTINSVRRKYLTNKQRYTSSTCLGNSTPKSEVTSI